jgi:hypothetical protein
MEDDDSWKEKGTFTSTVDPSHFLRVLYTGNSGQDEGPENDEPGPSIDVLALQLCSAPVATFLKKLVGHEVDKDNLVRMAKPFRLLIQNTDTIKDHLKTLQDRYRLVSLVINPGY